MIRSLLASRLLLATAVVAISAAGCGVLATQAPAPVSPAGPPGGLPIASTGIDPASAGVRAQIAAALSARNLVLDDAKVPFRPAEPPDLAAMPRSVYQVELRGDPNGGFIVVYELAGPQQASTAAASIAAYLGTGPGRVQAPVGTETVLRQVGAEVIYYRWLPGAIVDPDTPKIQEALETIGIAVSVPA